MKTGHATKLCLIIISIAIVTAFLLYFSKPAIAQVDGQVDLEMQECFLNASSGMCEGSCPDTEDGLIQTCVYDAMIMDCVCATPCDAVEPPNCEQAVCIASTSAGEAINYTAKCAEVQVGTTNETTCGCVARDCSEIESPLFCSGAKCPQLEDICVGNKSCEYPAGTQAICEPENLGCACTPTANCTIQVCQKDVCGAECGADADCVNMTGAGALFCKDQQIWNTSGSCDGETCSCVLGEQATGNACGGTGEDDWCAEPLINVTDCNVCDMTGDQDGDQGGWADSIADQCDPDCTSLTPHASGTAINASTYESEYGMEVTCDALDNNCDGVIDNIEGGASINETKCGCYNGTASTQEITTPCDGIDNDCDSKIDEDFDIDGDGYYTDRVAACKSNYPNKLDCNDNNASINYGATEVCDGVDNNCDLKIDNVAGGTSINETKCGCYSGAAPKNETFNGIDDDCDGEIDEGLDSDGDGFVPPEDCNDKNPNINPDADEICNNNIDDNCDDAADAEDPGCNITGNLIDQTIPTPVLGNDVCEPGENSQNACVDCGCPGDQECIAGVCETPSPAAVCGNDIKELGEECDGFDDDACLGWCDTDCVCPFVVGDGMCDKEFGESSTNSPEDCPAGLPAWVWALLIIVVIGGVGALIFFVLPKMKLTSLSEAHGLEPKAPSSKIESFVNSGLAEGFAPTQIKDTLTDQGIPEERANTAIASAGADLEELHGLTEKHGAQIPSEDTSGAESYINECVRKGYTPTQIKAALTSAGWDGATVENMLSAHTSVQKDLKSLAKKQGVAEPSEDVEKLKAYVRRCLTEGHTVEQIKNTLTKAGWSESMIREAIP